MFLFDTETGQPKMQIKNIGWTTCITSVIRLLESCSLTFAAKQHVSVLNFGSEIEDIGRSLHYQRFQYLRNIGVDFDEKEYECVSMMSLLNCSIRP